MHVFLLNLFSLQTLDSRAFYQTVHINSYLRMSITDSKSQKKRRLSPSSGVSRNTRRAHRSQEWEALGVYIPRKIGGPQQEGFVEATRAKYKVYEEELFRLCRESLTENPEMVFPFVLLGVIRDYLCGYNIVYAFHGWFSSPPERNNGQGGYLSSSPGGLQIELEQMDTIHPNDFYRNSYYSFDHVRPTLQMSVFNIPQSIKKDYSRFLADQVFRFDATDPNGQVDGLQISAGYFINLTEESKNPYTFSFGVWGPVVTGPANFNRWNTGLNPVPRLKKVLETEITPRFAEFTRTLERLLRHHSTDYTLLLLHTYMTTQVTPFHETQYYFTRFLDHKLSDEFLIHGTALRDILLKGATPPDRESDRQWWWSFYQSPTLALLRTDAGFFSFFTWIGMVPNLLETLRGVLG